MSNPFIETFSKILKRSPQAEPREGDYVDNGLIHCGKCGEPRELVRELPEFLWPKFGRTKIASRECRCERDESSRKEAEERAKREAVDMEERRRACFPYDHMRGMTFANDDGKNQKLATILKRYSDRFDAFKKEGAGLLLYGAVGGGKTYYAAAVANAIIDAGRSAKFTSLSNLSDRMMANYGKDKQDILRDLTRYDLVILDDLGVERSTDTVNENAYQVINTLYMSKTVIIATTNMDAEAMQSEQKPALQRTYSRLFECCQPIEVKGEDRRRTVSDAKARLYMGLSE